MVDFNVAISTIKDNNGFVSNDKDDSFYRTYLTKGAKPIQVRISNHGTHLWTWDKNGEYIPSYAINICVVLSPNGEVDSNTVVDMNVYDNARNIVGQKKDYEVIQYVYNCTNLNAEEVHKINETIINIPTTRNFIDPFRMDGVKRANVYRLKPNQKPQLLTQPIQENNKYTNKNIMKITEKQLRKIIKESVQSVLRENYEEYSPVWDMIEDMKQYISVEDILARLISKIGPDAAVRHLQDIKTVEIDPYI
jgi:hypothetical protein